MERAPAILAQFASLPTLVGLGLYGGAALLYIVALRRIPMSVALSCTAAPYVVALLMGFFVYAEPLGLRQVAAICLISTGVLLLAAS